MGSTSSTLLKIPNVEELVQETGCELLVVFYYTGVVVALERVNNDLK